MRGNAPRLNVQRPDRVISRYVPVYASVTNEYVHLNQQNRNIAETTLSNITAFETGTGTLQRVRDNNW